MSEKKINFQKLEQVVSSTVKSADKLAAATASKAKESFEDAKSALVNALDVNKNGDIDIEDIIILGMRTPGIRIDRDSFLKKELFKLYPQNIIDQAISQTPARAGIPKEVVDNIADEVIKYERNCVSGISAALGMPGGWAMVATIPADIAQYYGYMLRAAQKLMYLYGFPQIDVNEKETTLDSETINILTICLGVMYGVAGANKALNVIAKALSVGVEKKLLSAALTKGTIYPIVKSIAKWFGVKMTKDIFAGFFKKAIPVVGGIIGGGLTFASFKPCCTRLKASLRDTILSDPIPAADLTNHPAALNLSEVIDVDVVEIQDAELEQHQEQAQASDVQED